jgi:PPOX class probable F420-dependent enzyme
MRKTLDVRQRSDDVRLKAARVVRLATTDPDGRPHLVPIVFALEGDTLYSSVDRKPKRSLKLRRIENARARLDVTILVDHYEDDWGRLWWIRLRGRARVLDDGEERDRALALLKEKYPQYRAEPPDAAVLAVDITDAREWSAHHRGSVEVDGIVRLIRRTGGAAAPPPTVEMRLDRLGNLWPLPLGTGTAPTARTVPPVTPGAAGLTASPARLPQCSSRS